jgi:hypothetical protein
MKTTSRMLAVLPAALALLLLALSAGESSAAMRDVIADAAAICPGSTDVNLVAACDLVDNTNGGQVIDVDAACVADLGNGDNGVVDYLLRNCDQNETALLRKASSAVLSLNDVVNKGKAAQAARAADYLCTYASSYMTLQGAGKLISTEDLAADAQDIAAALLLPCP